MRIVAGAWRGRLLVAPPGQGTRPTADRVRQALFDMLMHAPWGGRSVVEGAAVLDGFAGTGALGLEALSRGAASCCFVESDVIALRALRANVAACKAEDRTEVLAVDILGIMPAGMGLTAGGATAPRVSWPAQGRGQRSARKQATAVPPRHGAVGASKSWVSEPHPILTQEEVLSVCPPIVRAQMAGTYPSMTDEVGGQPASLVFLDPPYAQTLVPRALRRLREVGRVDAGALVVAETSRDEAWKPEQPLLAERQYGVARILIFRSP